MKTGHWLKGKLGKATGRTDAELPGWGMRVAVAVLAAVVKTVSATWRIRIDDRAGWFKGAHPEPLIWTFWHNRQIIVPELCRRHYRDRHGVCILTSASRDGGLVELMLSHWGMSAVRGSSSRRRTAALKALKRAVDAGHDIGITPDGPRGPCYKLNPGPLYLSRMTATPIVCLRIKCASAWRLKSWDRFMFPYPFAKIDVVFEETIVIPRDCDGDEFETQRLKIEQLLTPSSQGPV